MTIAITGASGYTGRVLIPMLAAAGHSLRLLIHSGIPPTDAQLIKGDLLNEDSVAELVREADVVIHMAAVISIQDRPDEQTLKVNITGTRLLLEAARRAGVQRFIHLSSVTAFEQAPYGERLDESRVPVAAARHNYDYSKAVSQAAALEYNSKGMEVIVLAPTAIIGPFDYKPSLIGTAVIDICNRRIPALPPGGVDFVDVRDVAGAVAAALNKGVPGNVYLLSGQWVSFRTLSTDIDRITGKKGVIPVLPPWLIFAALPLVKGWARLTGSTPYYTRQAVYNLLYSNRRIDSGRAKTDLHFQPRPFEETLKDTIAWFRQNGMLSL